MLFRQASTIYCKCFHKNLITGIVNVKIQPNKHSCIFIKRNFHKQNFKHGRILLLPKINIPVATASLTSAPSDASSAPPKKDAAAGSPTPPAGPRITRQEPGPIRLGFIPNEWFMFFYQKTGVTGLGTFCFTLTIFLMSKEYYVLEHEYYGGLSMIVLCVLACRYIGPEIAKFIDSEIDHYEKTWTTGREKQIETLVKAVANEMKQQWSMEGQLILTKAKRENVHLQLEAAYRERLMIAYLETKKRLDFCMACENAERAFARRSMGSWIVEQVKESIDEDIQKKTLNQCMKDLKLLAKSFEGLGAAYKPTDPPNEPDDTPKPGTKK